MEIRPKAYTMTIILLTSLLACQPSDEAIREKIEEAVRQEVDNRSYEGGYDYELAELRALSFRRVNIHYLDSMDIAAAKLRYETFEFLVRFNRESKKSLDEEVYIDRATLLEKADNEKDFKEYADSLAHYAQKITNLEERKKGRADLKPTFFAAKTVIKGKFGPLKKLDTLDILLDKNYKVLRPNLMVMKMEYGAQID
ncbi:hypothetical protein GCM10027275_30670 [Rhabdobacter roseus]